MQAARGTQHRGLGEERGSVGCDLSLTGVEQWRSCVLVPPVSMRHVLTITNALLQFRFKNKQGLKV